MSTDLAIQSYRKIKPVYRAVSSASFGEASATPVISMSENLDSVYAGRPVKVVADPPGWNMPPLVRPYLKGRDNDPL